MWNSQALANVLISQEVAVQEEHEQSWSPNHTPFQEGIASQSNRFQLVPYPRCQQFDLPPILFFLNFFEDVWATWRKLWGGLHSSKRPSGSYPLTVWQKGVWLMLVSHGITLTPLPAWPWQPSNAGTLWGRHLFFFFFAKRTECFICHCSPADNKQVQRWTESTKWSSSYSWIYHERLMHLCDHVGYFL